MKSRFYILASLSCCAITNPGFVSAAPSPNPAQNRAPVLQNLIDCRAISDPPQRLACYDQRAAELEAAEKSNNVFVLDREQIEDAKREKFAKRGDSIIPDDVIGEDVKSITTTIEWIAFESDGRMRFGVKDGGTNWVQADAESIYPRPKAGSEVTLTKGSMGGFFATFKNKSIRVRLMR